MKLSSLQCCLDVIEADCQMSESSVDAVRQAKQHVSSCVEVQSATSTSDAGTSWMWLQRRSDTQLTDSQVCVLCAL